MRTDILASILEPWGIRPARERIDLVVAGSPERSASRHVVEDPAGALYLLESLEPATLARKAEIARALASLSARLPEINPYLPARNGRFVSEGNGRSWQVSRFIEGVPLDRPAYAFEGWRGPVLADFLVRLGSASSEAGLRVAAPGSPAFSLQGFIRDLAGKIEAGRPELWKRVQPAHARLEAEFFGRLEGLPVAFAHGDYHPLNVIWSADGIRAVVDWEFCGPKPAMYDAALLVGCLGMEDPRCLTGDCVVRLVAGLVEKAGYPEGAWEAFPDFVLAARFAWLSDWLRRRDDEMIDLEAVYLNLLLDNRAAFLKAWGLAS
jgi:homoserine kinase type II